MYNIILGLHIFVCFLLIIAVLLQRSKDSDVGAALGGGSGEMFGPRAPSTVMNKITTVIAACFLMLSLTLAVLSGLGSSKSSVLRNEALRDTQGNGGITITEDPTTPQPAPTAPTSGGSLKASEVPASIPAPQGAPEGSGK